MNVPGAREVYCKAAWSTLEKIIDRKRFRNVGFIYRAKAIECILHGCSPKPVLALLSNINSERDVVRSKIALNSPEALRRRILNI